MTCSNFWIRCNIVLWVLLFCFFLYYNGTLCNICNLCCSFIAQRLLYCVISVLSFVIFNFCLFSTLEKTYDFYFMCAFKRFKNKYKSINIFSFWRIFYFVNYFFPQFCLFVLLTYFFFCPVYICMIFVIRFAKIWYNLRL